jgi:hypothetical protein
MGETAMRLRNLTSRTVSGVNKFAAAPPVADVSMDSIALMLSV